MTEIEHDPRCKVAWMHGVPDGCRLAPAYRIRKDGDRPWSIRPDLPWRSMVWTPGADEVPARYETLRVHATWDDALHHVHAYDNALHGGLTCARRIMREEPIVLDYPEPPEPVKTLRQFDLHSYGPCTPEPGSLHERLHDAWSTP